MKSSLLLILLTLIVPGAYSQPVSDHLSGSAVTRDFFLVSRTATGSSISSGLLQDEDGTSAVSERKSVAQAALYSFLLPGMGELYVGNYGMGKYFTIAEGALWVTLYGVDRYAHWLQDDAYQYAAQHAGIQPEGKTDQYYIDIGNDSDIYAFNRRLLQSRQLYSVYSEAPNSGYYWKWDTDANRSTYRDMRVSSSQMFDNTHFVIAVIVLNHALSAINAARLAVSHNKSLATDGWIDMHARLLGSLDHPDGMMITVSKTF